MQTDKPYTRKDLTMTYDSKIGIKWRLMNPLHKRYLKWRLMNPRQKRYKWRLMSSRQKRCKIETDELKTKEM